MRRRDTRRDKVPGFFLGGMFSGSGGTAQSQNTQSGSNTISGPVPGSPYEVFQNEQLDTINGLSQSPFNWYDVNNFGSMSNDTQGKGWNMLTQAGSMWQPYFDKASGVLDKANAIDPGVAFDKAHATPTALSAADPWTQKAGQSWADVSSSYMNPYVNDVIKNTNELQSKNFLENVMPGISNTFVASGGGLGGKNYGKDMGWALTNFNDSLNRTNTAALSDEWNKAAGIFGNDASRWGALSNTVGNQATADRAGWTNLGNAQSGQIGALTALGGQYGNLGTGALGNQITGAQATLQAGNEQQAIENWKNQFNYEQFQKQQEYPFKTAAFAANTANQYTWPMRSNTEGWQNTTQSGNSSSSGSPFGSILGGLSAVGSLGKQFGGMFGSMGGGGGQMPGVPGADYGGSGSLYKRGGRVGYFAGGKVSPASRRAVHAHERSMHKGQPLTKMARGGYLGLDAPSMPPTIANPGYFKWMDSAAFKRGGPAARGHFAQGGGIGRGVGSQVGGMAGNMIGSIWGPIGGMVGKQVGRDVGGGIGTWIETGDIGKGGEAFLEGLADSTFNPPSPMSMLGGMFGGGMGGMGADMLGGSGMTFATGGHVPVVRAQRASNDRRLSAMRTKAQKPRGTSRQLAFPSPAVPTRPGFFS
jgi:hypothetical protein